MPESQRVDYPARVGDDGYLGQLQGWACDRFGFADPERPVVRDIRGSVVRVIEVVSQTGMAAVRTADNCVFPVSLDKLVTLGLDFGLKGSGAKPAVSTPPAPLG